MQKRKTFVSFSLCFCIFWPSSLRSWRSFTPLLQEIKNEPARGRKWGSFCAVDRGIGYRFAGRRLCSTRPPPPFCICCPGVCHWWICCVEKRWNNIRQTNAEWVPGADGESEPRLCGGFWSQNGSQGVDREGGALSIEEKLQLQTQIRPRRGAIICCVRSATSSRTPKLKLKARCVFPAAVESFVVSCDHDCPFQAGIQGTWSAISALWSFFLMHPGQVFTAVQLRQHHHPNVCLQTGSASWVRAVLIRSWTQGCRSWRFIYLFTYLFLALFLAEQLHFKTLNHVPSEGDAHLAKCWFSLGGGSICE